MRQLIEKPKIPGRKKKGTLVEIEAELLFKGLLVGISIAAPVGPIGLLCIRRTLTHGIIGGMVSGLGTALADALYGCVAVLGVSLVTAFLLGNQVYLKVLGGIFLLYLGYSTYRNQPAQNPLPPAETGLLSFGGTAFLLTLANPQTLLSFSALYAGMGMSKENHSPETGLWLVAGIFLGSLAWWLILSSLTTILRSQMDRKWLVLIQRVSGILIAGFGISCLFSVR